MASQQTSETYEGFTPGVEKPDFAAQPFLHSNYGHTKYFSEQTNEERKLWEPLLLRPVVPAILTGIMLVFGVGLQVALALSNKYHGFRTPSDSATSILHYVYTYTPVALVMIMIAIWTACDREIMKLQPYVDLAKGNAPPEKSLLLDYTNEPKFTVWVRQAKNKHVIATVSTFLLLILMIAQPFSAGLLTIRDTEVVRGVIGARKFGTVGLNADWPSLAGWASAAGFIEAQARYSLGRPPYVWENWAIDKFESPVDFISNGTLAANVTGIRTLPGCQSADSVQTDGQVIRASSNGCDFEIDLSTTTSSLYGAEFAQNCPTNSDALEMPEDVRPVLFWFASEFGDRARAAAVYCEPVMTLHDVTAEVDLVKGDIILVINRGDHQTPSELTNGQPPLNGKVFNGVTFNITNPTPVILQRANTTSLQLPAAMFLKAQTIGLEEVFDNSTQWETITSETYRTFLALAARNNFFIDGEPGTIDVEVKELEKRVWFSPTGTHILSIVLIITAITGAFIHWLHYKVRKNMRLFAQPGSIAVAASITANSPLANLVQPGFSEEKLKLALKGRKFRVDDRGKVELDGDEESIHRKPRKSIIGTIMR